MEEDRINTMEVHRDLTIENKIGTAPRGEQTDNNNQNFPPRRQQHAYFNEGYNRRYSPPRFLHRHSTTPWPVTLWVDP